MRGASVCMRQLTFSKLDLDLHFRAEELQDCDLDAHWNEDFAQWQARSTRKGTAMARRFKFYRAFDWIEHEIICYLLSLNA